MKYVHFKHIYLTTQKAYFNIVKRINLNGTFLLFLFFMFLVLSFRNIGFLPSIFGDEYNYSKFSRLLPFNEAIVPNYLYFCVYRATNWGADNFLQCVRLLNTVFFLLGVFFIYLITKKHTTITIAIFVSLLSAISPINTYTIWFMPESMYYFCFWLFTWLLFNKCGDQNISTGIFLGAILGLSSLVKPHGLFLFPVLFLFFFLKDYKRWTKYLSFYFFILLTALALKFSLGYLFAGKAGLSLFGSFYNATLHGINQLLDTIRLGIYYSFGHLLGLIVLFSLPITIFSISLIDYLYNNMRQKIKGTPIQILALYIGAFFIVLIPVTSIFTATVEPDQNRLHMRYYNFAFPLFFIFLALYAHNKLQDTKRSVSVTGKNILLFFMTFLLLYATITSLSPFKPIFIDSPELRGITISSYFFYFVCSISILTIFFYRYKPMFTCKLLLFVILPSIIFISTINLHKEINHRSIKKPNKYDSAGLFTKNFLPQNEISRLMLFGENVGLLHHTLFYLDNPKVNYKVIDKTNENLYWKELSPEKDWLLVIGDYPPPKNTLFQLSMREFTLYRLQKKILLTFDRHSSWLPGVISNISGLSFPEPWGTWSDGDVIVFEFAKPLPEKFTLKLLANAFTPSANKEFFVWLDTDVKMKKSFRLGEAVVETVLQLENLNQYKRITIEVPSPRSPQELGLSEDSRKLGIAFHKMEIISENQEE